MQYLIISLLQMKKVRSRKTKELAQVTLLVGGKLALKSTFLVTYAALILYLYLIFLCLPNT